MKIAVCAEGATRDDKISHRFGRAPYFVVVCDGETLTLSNDAPFLDSGAGVQSAQILNDHGVTDLIAYDIGPKAKRVLEAAGIRMWKAVAGTVDENLKQHTEDKLSVFA